VLDQGAGQQVFQAVAVELRCLSKSVLEPDEFVWTDGNAFETEGGEEIGEGWERDFSGHKSP
jgi:hypothetical protein